MHTHAHACTQAKHSHAATVLEARWHARQSTSLSAILLVWKHRTCLTHWTTKGENRLRQRHQLAVKAAAWRHLARRPLLTRPRKFHQRMCGILCEELAQRRCAEGLRKAMAVWQLDARVGCVGPVRLLSDELLCTHVHTHAHINACMHAYMCVYIYVHTYIHTYINACMHAYYMKAR